MKTWQKHEYIPFLLCILIIGIAVSASGPLITLFLVEEVHVKPATAGLFFLTVLTAPLVSITMGRFSDRVRRRKLFIILSALWLAVGWILMAFVKDLWSAILIGLLFFCISGTLSAQIFALLRDVMDDNKEKNTNVISSTVRTAFSLGWVLGPIIGSGLTFLVNVRVTFAITACLYVISLVPLWLLKSKVTHYSTKPNVASLDISFGSAINSICFALACVLVLCGDAIKTAYLPIYLVEGLKQNVVVFGSLVSTSAILELLLMPLFGVLADKIGIKIIMIAGATCGVAEYILLANSTHIWQLYIAQALHAGVISAFYGLGMSYAQQILRGQTGLASSLFFGVQSLASPMGSLLGSYSLTLLGIPHIFFLPFISCVLSVALLFLGSYLGGRDNYKSPFMRHSYRATPPTMKKRRREESAPIQR